MSDEETNASAAAEAERRFPIGVRALLKDQGICLENALRKALKLYYADGGDQSNYVHITVLVSDSDYTGAATVSEIDLDDYPAATLTFEREGVDPVTFKLEERMELKNILTLAGIVLAKGEKVFELAAEVELDEELAPGDHDFTLTIRPAPAEKPDDEAVVEPEA